MKNKLTRVLTMLAIFIMANSSVIYAQDADQNKIKCVKEQMSKTPEKRAQHFIDTFGEKLGLTDQQKKEIYNIKLKEITESKNIRLKQKQLKKQSIEDIKSTLTDEQQKSWKEMKAHAPNFKKGKKGCNSKAAGKKSCCMKKAEDIKPCCKKGSTECKKKETTPDK